MIPFSNLVVVLKFQIDHEQESSNNSSFFEATPENNSSFSDNDEETHQGNPDIQHFYTKS